MKLGEANTDFFSLSPGQGFTKKVCLNFNYNFEKIFWWLWWSQLIKELPFCVIY